MEISSPPVSSQTGKFTSYEQSESGEMHGSVFSEPSESRHQLGSESVQNEQGETSFSENMTKSPVTEQLGPPPAEVSNSGQAGKSSCPQKITLEKMHESDSGSIHGEPSDQKNQLVSKLIHNKPPETSSAVSSCADFKKPQSSSGNATNSSLTGPLQPRPQDVTESIETGKSLCPQGISLEQHESGSGGICGEPSEEKDRPGSELVQTGPVETSLTVPGYTAKEQLLSTFGNVTKSCTEYGGLPSEDVRKSSQTGKISSSQQTISEQKRELGSANDCLEQKRQLGSELVQNEPEGTITVVSSLFGNSVTERVELLPEDVSSSQIGKGPFPQQTISEQTHEFGSGISEQKHHLDSELAQNVSVDTSFMVPSCIVKKSSPIENIGPPPEGTSKNLSTEELGPPPEDMANNSMLEQLEMPPKNAINNKMRLGCKDKRAPKSLKKKYMLRSLVASDRILRSRTRGKSQATESSNNLANVSTVEEKQRKRKKIIEERRVADEFSRIRRHLRYLLNRMNYERSLIDAYSSEGWKGGSLEKLKPEKELQRATSEIFRRKLKIRDLFQRLDSLCAEGRLPNSLFDSEGEICSEDIFCAKCGSEELSVDNDIVLCDGACDRGFHQYCLEPPLLSEDIPPDDEGWLCPGCDCKVDCIDLLNDSQGTNLSISDSWEKVFPEAAAAAGHNPDHNFGLPSDDSDDNDYNPDEPADEKVQGDESSSDESEYASATEELEAPPNDEQYLGLPSDDSEDDDYDPGALEDLVDKDKEESSSSDFSSDSEDLAAAIDDNRSFGDDEGPPSTSNDGIKPLRSSGGKRSKLGGNKQFLNDELLSILESDAGQDGSAPVSRRRHVERLDYKELHDEAYGNVPTDSSDDEDYDGTAAPRKSKKREFAPVSPNGKNNETDHTPKRRTRQKANIEDTNNSPTKSLDGSFKSGSCGKRSRSSAYRRLGEAVTQTLYKSFKENQYPERATKESLAQELGLTFRQISKWFENARHSSRVEATADNASKKVTPSPQTNEKLLAPGPDTVIRDVCNGAQHVSPKSGTTAESSRENSTAPNSRKRKGRSNIQETNPDVRIEEVPRANEVQSGGGVKRRRRKY
ncbi:hypothetical protein FH972_004608 [Carpinus fangiana]|uniref:Homeobox domain-containing protein n=1 Tax=Carpinus fangiana TaxID=176857 RepID=A0A5N6QLM7_9ROSI|nr:hypothetical protein FH972_004608 [Carpinus fangiana]